MEDPNRIYYDYKAFSKILNAGDLIEFPRGAYSHWAVYIGNEKVAHLTGVGNPGANSSIRPEHMFSISGVLFSKAKVCIETLKKVMAGTSARKNNTRDRGWSRYSRADIVKRAKLKVGEVGYNIWFSNCEHFAKWCRYGKKKSDQVDNFFTGVAVGLAAAGVVGLVYASARYLRSDENEEEQNQNVAAKK